MKKLVPIIALSLVALASCVHDPFPPDPETICDQGGVDFVNEIQPLLTANCGMSGCHGQGSAQDGFSVESYSSIMDEVEPYELNEGDLWELINETDPNDRMPPPPASALTSDQKDLIKRWIMEGAQETDCGRTGCNYVSVPSYSTDIVAIADKYCGGTCHAGSTPSGGFTLTSKADWENAIDNRGLLDALTGSNGRKQMPPSGELDTCIINNINRWNTTGRN